jgi:thiamine monophosphate synthase
MKFLKLQTMKTAVQLSAPAVQIRPIDASRHALQQFQKRNFALCKSQKVSLIFLKKLDNFFRSLEENPRRASAGKLIFS